MSSSSSVSNETTNCDVLILLQLSHGPFNQPLSYVDNKYITPIGPGKESVFTSSEMEDLQSFYTQLNEEVKYKFN